MRTVSVNKHDLVDAIGQSTHAGFAGKGWSWQVLFDPRDTRAEARVVLVNPDVDHEVNYRLVNEDGYPVLTFADMNGYVWGEDEREIADRPFDDIKDVEAIRVPQGTRDEIEAKLKKHVQIGKDTFKVEYY